MKLNTDSWRYFRLDRLFYIKKGKRLTAEDQEDGKNLYIGAIDSNNGVANHISQPPIHGGNTISLSYNGSVGEAFYQPEPYWATDDVNVLYPKFTDFNEAIGLFISTIIRQEKYRFSYGRKWTLADMKATEISLPIQREHNGGIVIDKTKEYSDNGFVPDWQFMENFIKSLHCRPLTTKNKLSRIKSINTSKWKEYCLKDVFDDISIAKSADIGNLDEGNTPFVGRTDSNNGIQGYVMPTSITRGGCITLSMVGTNVALYQENNFQASQNVAVLRKNSIKKHAALFICSLINFEMQQKYSYGRTAGKTNIENMTLRLPIDASGQPDWNYMEEYMKSLPYGDRLDS